MEFSREHEELRAQVRAFVQEEINPHADAWEEAGGFPARELFPKLGERGFLGLSYLQAFGGREQDYGHNVVFLEELGQADSGGVALGVAVHTDMATPALAGYGSDELKQRFLTPAIQGKMVAAVAVTEPHAGSDVMAIRTRAETDGDHYVINGKKRFITNGSQADWFCLLARTSPDSGLRGMSLIVVPSDLAGVTMLGRMQKVGNWASDTAELSFENVRVPHSYRIGQEGMGFLLQMRQFQRERLAIAIMGSAAIKKHLGLTIQYLKKREAFGQPLIKNQRLHLRLAELLAENELLHQMTHYCAQQLQAGKDMTKESAVAKWKAGNLARIVADTCMQFHGGQGYLEETPIARFYRDAPLFSIGGGTDEIMLGIIAKYGRLV